MAELNCQMHVKTATDYDDIYLTSKSQLVEYDNATSGLSATDTKGAIDELASEKLDKVGDAKDTTVTFTEATTLANIVSGESNTTLWGKVKKMFSFSNEIITNTISFSNSNYATVGATNKYSYNNHRLDITLVINVVSSPADWVGCYSLPLTKTNTIVYYGRFLVNGGTTVNSGAEWKIENNKLYFRSGSNTVNYLGSISIQTNN